MNLLNETIKKSIISGIHNVTFTGYTPPIMRNMEDYSKHSGFITVNFLPRNEKYAEGLDYYLGPNGDDYSWFGYGQEEDMIIRAFAQDKSYIKGRDLSIAWLNAIESYLKINWNSLITGISISRTPNPYRDIGSMFIKNHYGYELNMPIYYMNIWTDKPITGTIDSVPISGVEFEVTT